MDGFKDDFDVIHFDEWNAQKPTTFMNEFLEGNIMNVQVKGSHIDKVTNTPVIITSNKSPAECYSKVHKDVLDAFVSRLLVVKVEKRINILFK